jgi:hypothetical protein
MEYEKIGGRQGNGWFRKIPAISWKRTGNFRDFAEAFRSGVLLPFSIDFQAFPDGNGDFS